ncbi:DUF1616 domain-containing protein [Chloroflexota bacterium]
MEESTTDRSIQTGGAIWGKVLYGILALLILGAVAALFYSVASPFKEPFTEFYLLDLDGKAENYPSEIIAGEEAMVLVGVTNREYRTMSYKLAVKADGEIFVETERVVLKHDEDWKEIAGFILNKAGANQTVEFLLYDNESGKLYHTLHLVLYVK